MNQWNKPPLGSIIDHEHPLSRGLVMALLMNEGSGNRIYDLTNNGNDGVLTNGPLWKPGRNGAAIEFDGNNDRIECGSNTSLLSGAFSISARMRNKLSATAFPLCAFPNAPYILAPAANNLPLLLLGNNNYRYFNNNPKLYDGNWRHVVFTVPGGGINDINSSAMYLESRPQTVNATVDTVDQTAKTAFRIGARQWLFSNGDISDFRIWNRALFPDEVKDLYINPYGFIYKPQKYWLMPQGVTIPPHLFRRVA